MTTEADKILSMIDTVKTPEEIAECEARLELYFYPELHEEYSLVRVNSTLRIRCNNGYGLRKITNYLTSVDAAMTLLPDGLVCWFEMWSCKYEMHGKIDRSGVFWTNERVLTETLPRGICALAVMATEYLRERKDG